MNHRKFLFLFITVLSWLVIPWPNFSAVADDKPLWELGIGAGYVTIPDYRGSDQSRHYILPFPHAIYRGNVLRVDDNGVSGRLFSSDRIILDTSFYGSVPVRSKDNDTRTGMPDLDPSFEIGPELCIKLIDSKPQNIKITITLPLRTVYTTDFKSIQYEGLVFSPRLNIENKEEIKSGIDLWFSLGPIFADQRYHDHFYEVEPQYAAPARPEYHPGQGYSGMSLTLGFSKKYNPFIFRTFISVDYIHGSSFEGSPLVKQNTSIMWGFSLVDILFTSKETVHDFEK